MAALTNELKYLLSGDIVSKADRRALTCTVVARWIVMVSVIVAAYAALRYEASPPEAARTLLAGAVATVTSHISLTFKGWDHRIRGAIIIMGVLAATALSEDSLCRVLGGRSTVVLAIPILLSSSLIHPRCSLICFATVAVGATANTVISGHAFPLIPLSALFVVAVISWLNMARADHVIDRLQIEKQAADDAREEMDSAIGVVISYERASLRREELWTTTAEKMADASKN